MRRLQSAPVERDDLAVLEKTRRVAFGLFEADLHTGELWKAGRRIRLQGQPFRVLSALLQRPGTVITREELQGLIWGPDTNVDFERALAGAINKVRDALGDSADNPRFVETLARRGYRFIAPVAFVPEHSSSGSPDPKWETPGEETGAGEHTSPDAPPAPGSALGELFTGMPQAVAAATPAGSARPSNRRSATLLFFLGISLGLLAGLAAALWARAGKATLAQIEQVTQGSLISPGPPNEESLPALVIDGDRILTSVLTDGRPRLAGIYLGSGEAENIALPRELASVAPVDLSRDETRLLVLSRLSTASEQPLWIVPTGGGSALRVGSVLAHDAAWMPDGASILYASGNSLSLFSQANQSSTPFLTLPGRAFWMRWSPDGTLLRFTVVDTIRGTRSLWELKKGSRVPHRVSGVPPAGGSDCCGVWTADGEDYVFQETRPGSSNLWDLKKGLLGTTLRQLTSGPLGYFSPVAARSGTRIFFLGSGTPLGVELFDARRRQFVPGPAFLANASRIDYSRDGVWVAWTDASGRLWRARAADGTEKLQLTPPDMSVFLGHWSPDAKRLALMARLAGQPWRIYVLDADGGALKQVVTSKRNVTDPTWSPDGAKLAFGREPDWVTGEANPRVIETVDLASQQVVPVPGSAGLFSPRWSPDGRWIAALSLDQKQVMLFNTHTGKWQLLAATSAGDPVWSRDSKALYVHAFQKEEQPIVRISVPSGEMETIADLSQLGAKGAADYFFSGLTPDNEPLILPRVGTSDLYTLALR